jgi:hypothetical protein
VALSLALHNVENGKSGAAAQFMQKKPPVADAKDTDDGKAMKDRRKSDPAIPAEFLCAINGHVMKDPVKVRSSGLVFEQATIELWLATRGNVCPITNTFLQKADLEAEDDLRNR